MNISKELQKLIGERITFLRTQNNQTQQDIEFITGIDAAEVSKYESGKRNLTLKTLSKFAVALSVHPKELFNFNFDIENYNIEE